MQYDYVYMQDNHDGMQDKNQIGESDFYMGKMTKITY